MASVLSHSALLFFCVPLIFCFFIIPVFIRLSIKKKLLEKKGGRRIHVREVPSMGGIPIFFAFLIGIAILFSISQLREIRFLMGASFLIFILGLRDDLIPLRPSLKLISQIFPALIVIYDPVFNIQKLVYAYGTDNIYVYLIYFLLIILILFLTNSINLVDGIDGLAGSLSFITLQFFSISFYLQEQYLFMSLSLLLTGAIVAFLYYNWSPARIFMGDTGALVIGFLIAVFVLKLFGDNEYYNNPFAICLAAVAVPVYDTLRTFLNRILRGKSPFFADKTHIHHLILRLGMSHQKTTLILATLQLIIIIATVVMESFHEAFAVLVIILIIFGFNYWLEQSIKRRIKSKSIVQLRQ